MEEIIVEVKNFKKVYGSFVAVDNISFNVQRGEIFALLGPNGAGKTTTLECLEGLRQPDAGRLRIATVDPLREPHRLKNLIGVQLQASGMPDNISVREAMRFFCAYHRVAPRYDLLERMGLSDKLTTQYHMLSGGQKRRLALALAVAHNPPVIILDEPTAALDVLSRNELHNVMRELREEGTTIILSSHDMAEVEKLADRIAILLRGKIVAEGTPRELTTAGTGFTKISVQTENHSLADQNPLPGVRQHGVQDDYQIYHSTDVAATVLAILEHIQRCQDTLVDLRVERPSLEDRFLEITGSQEAGR
ncbi:MAG TPA: ABC transporter ATP-binding protein [Phototrophicaceae bacterium]|nr:ABC transporter ATP-binding protein [Phototrophicaceae bacterium]